MRPTLNRLFSVIDATWPPARIETHGPWHVRQGLGGGQRVSATTRIGVVTEADIGQAEAAMDALGQPRIFMMRPEDEDLDGLLEARGYAVVDPVNIYLCPSADLAIHRPPPVSIFELSEPLAVLREIWAEAGIGPARLAVMSRVRGPHVYLLGRMDGRPGGGAFVGAHEGAHDGVAMLHALEVKPQFQRKGLGRYMMWQTAHWAQAQGLEWVSVICVQDNIGANELYKSIGMQPMGGYHYRRWLER